MRGGVFKVGSDVWSGGLLASMVELFDTLSSITRLKMLLVLLEGESCPCELAEKVGVSLPAISHQLRLLKDRKIVSFRREGKTLIYSLTDGRVERILKMFLEEISGSYKR